MMLRLEPTISSVISERLARFATIHPRNLPWIPTNEVFTICVFSNFYPDRYELKRMAEVCLRRHSDEHELPHQTSV